MARPRSIACFAVIGLLLIWSAEGDDEPSDPEELPGGEMHLGAVDAPALEMLSPDEMRSLHARIDSDKDGSVSLQEMLQLSGRLEEQKDPAHLSINELDTSKDGKLSMEEVLQDNADVNDFFGSSSYGEPREAELHLKKLVFNIADKDTDGILTEGELDVFFSPSSVHKALTETSMTQRDKDVNQRLSILEFFTEPGSAYHVESEEELGKEDFESFRELDRDASGDLDLEELLVWESGQHSTKADLRQMVTDADVDQSGHVSLEEFLAARDQIKGTNAMFHLLEWHAHEEL